MLTRGTGLTKTISYRAKGKDRITTSGKIRSARVPEIITETVQEIRFGNVRGASYSTKYSESRVGADQVLRLQTDIPSRMSIPRSRITTLEREDRSATIPLNMPFAKSGFHALPEKKKWPWRVIMILVTIGNVWEWFRHVATGNIVVAVIDAVFALMCVGVLGVSFLK